MHTVHFIRRNVNRLGLYRCIQEFVGMIVSFSIGDISNGYQETMNE